MGLLDDAIREHLELKRRRGGDPSAIAREEREALTTGGTDEPTDEGEAPARDASPHAETDAAGAFASAPHAAGEPEPGRRAPDMSAGGQDTAELDMQAVMEDDPDAADPGAPEPPIADAPAFAGRDGDPAAEDPLEWEFPSEREREREPPPQEIPGQERLSFE